MTMVDLPSGGFYMSSCPLNTQGSTTTIDAVGESISTIGRIRLEAGSGSKTISAAGSGKIFWRSGGSVTFANAGTTVRVGIQDIGGTGLEDGTFDVYGDHIGGGGTIPASSNIYTTMGTGTKTINHGDTVSICIEMTARGGVDTVGINSFTVTDSAALAVLLPYRTTDTGTLAKTLGAALAVIIFDDGTLGWIERFYATPNQASTSTTAFNSGSSPDEYASLFQVPFRCSIEGAWVTISSVTTTSTFEVILYSDPFGVPVADQTVVCDPFRVGSTGSGGQYHVPFTRTILEPGEWYGLAVRPTSGVSLSNVYTDFTSGRDNFKRMLPFGENAKVAGRTNQTGPFAETQAYHMPMFGLQIVQLDDGIDEPPPEPEPSSVGFFMQ